MRMQAFAGSFFSGSFPSYNGFGEFSMTQNSVDSHRVCMSKKAEVGKTNYSKGGGEYQISVTVNKTIPWSQVYS